MALKTSRNTLMCISSLRSTKKKCSKQFIYLIVLSNDFIQQSADWIKYSCINSLNIWEKIVSFQYYGFRRHEMKKIIF